MTSDVDVCGVGDVPKGDVEEKGSYQDLRRENNGVVIISGSNADKEDVDVSYVFVGGSNSVSNDHVEPLDLNGVAEVVVVENGDCNENNGGGGGLEGSEREIKVGQVRGSNGAEEENGSKAVGEFEPKAHPQPQRLEVEEQIKVEESSEDARQIKRSHPVVPDAAESEVCKSSMQVHDGRAQDSNLDSTAESEMVEIAGEEDDTKPDLSTEGKENHESGDIISMDVQNDFVQEEATELETNETPLEDAAQDNLVVDMTHSDPSPVAERELETEVSNTGPVAVENGDGSPINLTQDNYLKSLGANQITAEQNGSSENAKCFSSTPFGCGNAVANEITVELDSGEREVDLEQNSNTEVDSNENGDCLPTDPDQDIISENSVNNESAGVIQSTAEQNGSSQDAESLPSAPFVCANEVSVEAFSGKHEAGLEQSSKTKVVPNQNGNCLPTNHDQAIISEISVHNDLVGTIKSTPEQNGSLLNMDCLQSPVVCGSVLESGENFPSSSNNDTAAKENIENGPAANEIPVEADSGELEVDVQQSSNTEVVSVENGVCIPADDQNGISEISVNNDSVGAIQNTPEQNGSSQNVDCLLSPSMSGNKLLESSPTAPNNDTVVKEDTNKEAKNGLDYNISSCHAADDAKLETETGSVAIDSKEKVTDFPADDPKKGPEVSNLAVDCADGQPHPVAATDVQCHVNSFVENDLSMKSETEVESTLTLSSRDMPCDDDDDIKSDSKVPIGSANLIESALNCDLDVDGGDQFTGTDSGSKPSYQGAEVVSGINCDETSTPSPEGSTDAFEGQNAEVVKRPFYYLIRLPRYDDKNLREQTTHAQLQVDEKTQNRDAIQAEIQMKRVTLKEYGDNLEATLLEEEAARDLLKSKRKEMDSAQSVINRLKNVIFVKGIDGRIRNMEHAMQHETLPLTEEKQFIREINQLKQHRAQLSSNIGQQDDVQEALDQKEKTEARLKLLRKELDILRDNVLKAEAVTKTAKKKYNGESEKLKELQAQFIAADAIRQEAYAHLQSLKKQFYEKNKHFRKYRDDINAAADLASKVKREELQRLCVNQVEKVMELWNKNDEFRKEYIRCNTRSTLRRLRTLDGRSLGPDEEPPLIPDVVYERMRNALPQQSAAEQGKQIVQLETEKVKDKPFTVDVEQKKQTTKSKVPVKPAPLGNGLATVSGREEIEEAREEEPKETKEEEELARKMEQLRREEEAAKLREQHLLEEKAKAKEALERKKRKAEKAQAKAMFRLQREAEEKEKEREKRAMKKERKKVAAGAVEATDGDNKKEAAPNSETTTESLKESETKRSKKPSQFSKQSKAKSIPPPLRNRNKRRMQPWMWVLLTALIVFALFLVGNSSFSFDFGRQRFGF